MDCGADELVYNMGRSLESPALFRDFVKPATLPVEIRSYPWRPVESGLMRLGLLNHVRLV